MPAGHPVGIGNRHYVHGAIANIAQHVDALEIGQMADDSGEALREHIHAGDADTVFLLLVGERDLILGVMLHKILFEIVFLFCHPS